MRFLAALLVCLVAPGIARAAKATLVSRDLPLGGRTLAAAEAPIRFNLVGLHWQGSGSVSFRTRSLAGRWSVWRPAAPEDDRPDRRAGERSRPGWRLGNPYWTGASTRIQYRLFGSVRRVRAYFVWSATGGAPLRVTSIAGSPAIVPRLSWGADESIKRGTPHYAPAVAFSVVHHTAGSNSYTREESAAIVRGIQLYHVKANGWNDIGYNVLVDKYGQVFEGRYGGIDRNVVGAHAEGFNRGSVGVAVIGNYGAASLSAAARSQLVRLLAWRLDVAHVDPLSTLSWLSGGNSRFPAGVPVFLRSVSGHRDTGFTSCPGDRLYGELNPLAGSVAATGLPKLYAPSVRSGLGGKVRFTARLSAELPWTVTVKDALGATVATGSGQGTGVDWTWDAAAAPPSLYSYSIEAGATVRPVTGTLGREVTLPLLSDVAVSPATVTPNADGMDDTTIVSYTLAAPARVTATILDVADRTLATLFSERKQAGRRSFRFTAEAVPDGRYRIVLSAVADDGRQAEANAFVIVSRLLRGFVAKPAVFSPNGDRRRDRMWFPFELAGPAQVKLRILRAGRWVATVFSGGLAPGSQQITWDGSRPRGRLRDGRYEAVITVTDPLASISQAVPFASDTTPPHLRLISLRRLRFRVSEPATITLLLDGKPLVHVVERSGVFRVPYRVPVARLRAVAWDRAGNTSEPVLFSLR